MNVKDFLPFLYRGIRGHSYNVDALLHFTAVNRQFEQLADSVISVVKFFSVSVSVSFFTGFFRFSFVSVFTNFSVSVSVSCIFQFQFPFPFQLNH